MEKIEKNQRFGMKKSNMIRENDCECVFVCMCVCVRVRERVGIKKSDGS